MSATRPMTARAQRGWTLAVVCVGTFMLLLDVTIVNIALPDIEEALGATLTDLQWVVAGYAVALSAALLTAGSLADRFGRRTVFAWGMTVFTIASAICGLADEPLLLNLARALQGMGGAALLATSLALLTATFTDDKGRRIALGVWGAMSGAALAVGPLVGGALVESAGWRWIFLVNLPVGALCLIVVLLRVPESRAPAAGRVDWLGFLTLGTSLGSLSFALLRANEEGWTSNVVLGAFGLAAVMFVLFLIVERAQRNPMLPVSVFSRLTTTGASLAVLAMSSTAFALLLYITLYLQTVLGHDPFAAGLRLLPFTLSIFVASAIAARLGAVLPIRGLVSAGLVCIGVGLWLMGDISVTDDWTTLLVGQIVVGVGVGLVNPNVVAAAMGSVHPDRAGVASGLNNTFRSIGIALGVAALGAVFVDRVRDSVSAFLAGTPLGPRAAELTDAVSSGRVGEAMASLPEGPERGILSEAARMGFVDGLNDIFAVAAVVALIGAAIAFFTIRAKDMTSQAGSPGDARPTAHAVG